MIQGGVGGANTLTGLKFEARVDLKELFRSLNGYSILDNDLYFNGKIVAKFLKKHDLYRWLEGTHNIDYKTKISKKLLPDEVLFVISNNTLYIIEMKFQETSGSVDEKLQTCDFKKKEYLKLVKDLSINLEYVYILNDWFKDIQYKDTLDYITSVGCHYFFNTLPLSFLGLPYY
jgi:hypothetical protein